MPIAYEDRLVVPDMLGTPGQDHNEARLERACPCGSSPARSTGSAADPYIRPAAAVSLEIRRSPYPELPAGEPPPPALRPQPVGCRRPATHRERALVPKRSQARRAPSMRWSPVGRWLVARHPYLPDLGRARVLSVGPGLDRYRAGVRTGGARKLAWPKPARVLCR